MDRMPLVIGGVDVSRLFNLHGYTALLQPVDGGLGGVMQDGSETADIRGWRTTITAAANDLDEADLELLLGLCARKEVQVTYYEHATARQRTAAFYPTLSGYSMLMVDCGTRIFRGLTVTLRSREVVRRE